MAALSDCACCDAKLQVCWIAIGRLWENKRLISDYHCSSRHFFHCKIIAQQPKNKPKYLDIWLSGCTWICVSKYFAAIKILDIIKNLTACRNLKFDLHTALSSKKQICQNCNRFSGWIIQEKKSTVTHPQYEVLGSTLCLHLKASGWKTNWIIADGQVRNWSKQPLRQWLSTMTWSIFVHLGIRFNDFPAVTLQRLEHQW